MDYFYELVMSQALKLFERVEHAMETLVRIMGMSLHGTEVQRGELILTLIEEAQDIYNALHASVGDFRNDMVGLVPREMNRLSVHNRYVDALQFYEQARQSFGALVARNEMVQFALKSVFRDWLTSLSARAVDADQESAALLAAEASRLSSWAKEYNLTEVVEKAQALYGDLTLKATA